MFGEVSWRQKPELDELQRLVGAKVTLPYTVRANLSKNLHVILHVKPLELRA